MKPEHKYTLYGSDAFHCKIDSDIKMIKDRLLEVFGEASIEALVLIGGYGRGEGAVLIAGGEEKTFNDYDFFLVTKHKFTRTEKQQLGKIAAETSKATGIEVDLYPVDKNTFLQFPLSLMNCEMKAGSLIPYGNDNILNELPDYDFNSIPRYEGTRLLLNRGILLIYVQQKLSDYNSLSEEQRTQLLKYVFKALLAIGDSYLLATGKYALSYPVKAETLKNSHEEMNFWPKVKEKYSDAVEFKLKVDLQKYETLDLNCWVSEALELFTAYFKWFEEQRLKTCFQSWDSYSEILLRKSRKFSPLKLLKNILLSVRNFGVIHTLKHPFPASCYPRARLFAMMAYFFDCPEKVIKNQYLIGSQKENDPEKVFDRFWTLWLKYS